MTVEAYQAQWRDMTRQRVRPSTHQSDGYRVKDRVELLDPKLLSQLRPVDIRGGYTTLVQTRSLRSVQYSATLLRAALEAAVGLDLLPTNPVRRNPYQVCPPENGPY